jgi:general secretion pathway protein M
VSTRAAPGPLMLRWKGLAPRERLAVGVAAVAVVLLVAWMLLVQPALRTLRAAPAQLDAVDAQMQQLQRMAGEARGLRGTPPVPQAQANEALRASLSVLGDNVKLAITGDRATVTLNGVDGEDLADWLADVRSAARARPIEAQLSRGPDGFRGSLVLQLGAGS